MYADKFHSKSVPPKFLQVEAVYGPSRADLAERTNSDGWIWVAGMACRIFRRWRRSMGMRMI